MKNWSLKYRQALVLRFILIRKGTCKPKVLLKRGCHSWCKVLKFEASEFFPLFESTIYIKSFYWRECLREIMQISEYNVHDPDVVLMNNNLPPYYRLSEACISILSKYICNNKKLCIIFSSRSITLLFIFFFLKQKLCRCSFILFIFLHSMINDQLKLIKDTIEWNLRDKD